MSKSLKTLIKSSKIKKENKIDETDSYINELNNTIKVDELIDPCIEEILTTTITLSPYQMNNDLYINLKKNLIDKVEGKCNKNGFVVKVYNIIEYSNGIIEPEDFSGSATYIIKYIAKVCVALKDSIIVAKIISNNISQPNFIVAQYSEIIRIIITKKLKDWNINYFNITNDSNIIHIPTNKVLEQNDYLKIQLKVLKFNKNDTVIKCIGYAYDIATPEEIASFAFNNEINSNLKSKKKSIIYYNEDIEIE